MLTCMAERLLYTWKIIYRWHAAGRAVDAIGLWVTMIASRDHRVPLLRLDNEIEMNTSVMSRLPPKATPRPVFFSSKGMTFEEKC
ncbi:hypothetical protein I7I53_00625 [Histoplasma capsulatum var. duboisii H88]|uniref:Uncharacterized protein n=1 Tax=Ajellomyces capsulatus (strain H88) TaxID=544711 RepID=A0A8A1LIS4_AJEC8|nr:hypothetical protein I7I53_00625 [Histoplasma capsulatum var. duboisii H88]